MRTRQAKSNHASRASTGAFTLTEAIIAFALAAIVLVSLYASFTTGFAAVRVAREDLRATQIILQRMERIRLCTFEQALSTVTNPPAIMEYFDPQSAGNGGATYSVSYSASVPASGLPDSYRTNMLLVTVGVTWNSGNVQRSRSLKTYLARNGIEGYVYNPAN